MTSLPSFDHLETGRHLRLDPSPWERIYVVGDVHGCRNELGTLLSRLRITDEDLVLFVGDLVRKGPDSAGVVELVREHENLHSVRGNNEAKLIRGDAALPELSVADRAYLHELPLAISLGDSLVVHGGVDPRKPLSEQSPDDLVEMRSPEGGGYDGPFWYEAYDGPMRVFFGHTVHRRPVETEWAVGLDTGCVYGGQLTAYDWRAGRFVSVPGRLPEWSRPDDEIVTPVKPYAAGTR
jgi:serine/threonine protein phosphatase 1